MGQFVHRKAFGVRIEQIFKGIVYGLDVYWAPKMKVCHLNVDYLSSSNKAKTGGAQLSANFVMLPPALGAHTCELMDGTSQAGNGSLRCPDPEVVACPLHSQYRGTNSTILELRRRSDAYVLIIRSQLGISSFLRQTV